MGDRLATIEMGWKVGADVPSPFFGEVGPHLTQCRLGRGLSPYQVASWSIQPFGHNRHGPTTTRKPRKGADGHRRQDARPRYFLPRPTPMPIKFQLDPSNRLATKYTSVKTDRTGTTTVRYHRASRFTNGHPTTSFGTFYQNYNTSFRHKNKMVGVIFRP